MMARSSYSVQRGQPVLYVTERCVFKLTPDGLELTKIAPGIDIERDPVHAANRPAHVSRLKLLDPLGLIDIEPGPRLDGR
jgi:propionate CoA-transferase